MLLLRPATLGEVGEIPPLSANPHWPSIGNVDRGVQTLVFPIDGQ